MSQDYISSLLDESLQPKLKIQLQTLPDAPGVYQYFDKEGHILYVGKAKSLKWRVLSYFRQDKILSAKIKLLVKKIHTIRYTVMGNEMEALLLENNLIKEFQPKYNSLLKDDKTYPWVCITKEEFPKIFVTRKMIKDGSSYYGPFPSGKTLKDIMDLLRSVFRYRNCSLKLNREDIAKGKFKSCISYQLKLCNAPCEGLESMEGYQKTFADIRKVFDGDFSEIIDNLKKEMFAYAKRLEFEKADEIKKRIFLLEQHKSRSMIVGIHVADVDVFGVHSDEKALYLNMLRVKNGSIIQSFSTHIQRKLEETDAELLAFSVYELHERFKSTARKIIVPFPVDLPESYIKQSIPTKGDEKKLLELSQKNAFFYTKERQKQQSLIDPEKNNLRLLETIQKDLNLNSLPIQIECFDNSNIQGNYPVAAMVCFKNGKPAKREYRHFIIRSVVGPNDFASMEEVVYRRYKRLLEEQKPLPQLIVIDGGKGQLSSAVKSLKKLGLYPKIAIIGIAKRLEEIFYPEDNIPLLLDKRSPTLKVIQQLRDEAHRFGITHHRKKRSKETFYSELSHIDGIGTKTTQDLLLKYSSVRNIKNLSLAELSDAIGKHRAEKVYEYFHREDPFEY